MSNADLLCACMEAGLKIVLVEARISLVLACTLYTCSKSESFGSTSLTHKPVFLLAARIVIPSTWLSNYITYC